ncbi:MAG: efflux RND transporter periplasmic adaptor subunit [Planctomycetota bacterium]
MSRNMAVLTLAVMAACSSDNAQQSTTVNLYQVSREDLPINVKEGGELVAVNETVVRSAIEGNATVLYLIPEGTSVSKGEKLVELDVSDLVEKRATQEISVEKARNALEQAKTAQDILEKELQANINTAESQRRIATMELEKLLGAKGGRGSEGKNADMVKRLEELVNPAPSAASEDASPASGTEGAPTPAVLVTQVHPQNYAGLVNKVVSLLKVKGEAGDPLERDMGEMANLILQQADQIRLAMADLKVKEDTAAHSRSLAQKQFITRNELERDELAYQSQASKVTIAWNDLELLVNYTLERDKIEKGQNVENAELEVARVAAKNGAERRNSQFDVDAKKKEFEVAAERLANLEKQIGNSVLVSPGEGLVVYSKVSRGRGDSEPVEEGTSVRERQSIIILPDNSKLECKIQVQEAMIDKVRVGMAALISAEVRPNEVMTGRVTYVAPVADSQSRWSGNDKKVYTTKVLLDGINKDESLKAGMKAAATITVGSIKDALTVPIQAVRRDRAVNYIWKQSENGPVAVAVKVGANNEEKVEILSGLAEGDMIYRTPPGGQADPKFDQPAMPEAAPMESAIEGSGAAMPAAAAAAAGAGGRPAKAAQASSRRGAAGGGRPQGSRSARKKFADMDAAELAQAKKDLPKMLDRFSAYLSEEKLVEANKMVGEIEKALDAGETEKADRLRSTGLRKLMSGGSAGRRGNE